MQNPLGDIPALPWGVQYRAITFNLLGITMKYLFVLFALLLAGCTQKESTIGILKNEGYTDIRITGYDWFTCGEDDTYSTGFVAKNRNGVAISGAVCSGIMKGSTIRYN